MSVEKQLKKLFKNLQEKTSEAEIDGRFAKELRAELLEQAGTVNRTRKENSMANETATSPLKKYMPLWAGAAVLAVVVLGFVYLNDGSLQPNRGGTTAFLGLNITKVGSEAFGELGTTDQQQARNQSGGGGGSAAEAAAPQAIGLGGGGGTASSFPADLVRYQFVYQGEEFSIDEATMDVLKRIKGNGTFPLPSSLSGSFSNLVNLGSFGGLSLQSISAGQGTDTGFDVYIDYREERVGINQTYPFGRTQEIIAPLQISDVPADDTLISAADRFLSQHGVNLDNYGTPEVRNEWLVAYERAPDKSQFYIPNTISVIYPLVVNGQEVYDQGGYKSGIGVNIKIPGNEVIGVWDISSLNFQSSAYATETDVSRILQIAERGGAYGYYDFPEATRTVDVPLGTPKPVLIRIWQWDGNSSTELLVPGLVFPITQQPTEGYFYQQNVVIPIIKQILDQNDRGPIPVPFLEEGQ